MTEYLMAFNDDWVPDLTDEDLRDASERVKALRAEMQAAGVLIFTGGLDDEAPAFSVEASRGTPAFTNGPYAETRSILAALPSSTLPTPRLRGCGREDRGRLRLAAGDASDPGRDHRRAYPRECLNARMAPPPLSWT